MVFYGIPRTRARARENNHKRIKKKKRKLKPSDINLPLIYKFDILNYMQLNQRKFHATFNHLLVSFLFVFQNDNDLIDNDNAGQSPAAQAVVLTFSLTYYYYYLLSTLFRFILAVRFRSNSNTRPSCVLSVYCKSFLRQQSTLSLRFFLKVILTWQRKGLLQQTPYFDFCTMTRFSHTHTHTLLFLLSTHITQGHIMALYSEITHQSKWFTSWICFFRRRKIVKEKKRTKFNSENITFSRIINFLYKQLCNFIHFLLFSRAI